MVRRRDRQLFCIQSGSLAPFARVIYAQVREVARYSKAGYVTDRIPGCDEQAIPTCAVPSEGIVLGIVVVQGRNQR